MPDTVFLLDTNIVSNLRKPKPHPELLGWLASVESGRLRIAVPTLTEIRMGIERTRKAGGHAKADEILAWFDGYSARTQAEPLSAEAAVLWGAMLESPLRDDSFRRSPPAGRRPRTSWVLDLMIASICITRGHVLVTDNTKDFRRIHEAYPLPGLLNPMR